MAEDLFYFFVIFGVLPALWFAWSCLTHRMTPRRLWHHLDDEEEDDRKRADAAAEQYREIAAARRASPAPPVGSLAERVKAIFRLAPRR
jgi:hypothetical protein